MTPDERAALVEKLAKAMYERWQSTRTNAPSWDLLYTSSRASEIADAVVALDLITPIIRAQALEEAADPKFLRPIVEEQSQGEWDDKTIDDDVAKFSAAILALIPEEEKL